MIDWKKMCVCDSCMVTSSDRKPVSTYTITFSRTRKEITLCRKCMLELLSAIKNTLEAEECK